MGKKGELMETSKYRQEDLISASLSCAESSKLLDYGMNAGGLPFLYQ
jgi:hypothetical protein